MRLICSYCICYTSNSTATEDFFNVSDVKFIFKKQCNSLLVPAQIFATGNTCDTAVAAIAKLAPQLHFKVGMKWVCPICTVRNLQHDHIRTAFCRQLYLTVFGVVKNSWSN